MALQTKTWTTGDYAYQSWSNGYKIALKLSEESTDGEKNTSRIYYEFSISNGGNNRFYANGFNWDISIGGTTIQIRNFNFYVYPYNVTQVIASGYLTVPHSTDGTLNMPYAVSIPNVKSYTSYGPPAMSLSGSWQLTDIPRASSIASAANVVLGNACSVQWVPNSSTFYYKLRFSLGDWAHTTGAIHPNKTSAHTYKGYTIPLEVASRITNDDKGKMTVVLGTYSDSACTKLIGNDSEEFTVTVPETAETKPEIRIDEIVPVHALPGVFGGLFLRGKSALKASVTTELKYGASVAACIITVEGKTYAPDVATEILSSPEKVKVKATVKDSRKFYGTYYQDVTVYDYEKPKAVVSACARCAADGTPDEAGTCLRITAQRSFSAIVADGVQKNKCRLRWRWKIASAPDSGYSDWAELIGEDEDTDAYNGVIDTVVFAKENSYVVQIGAEDTVGDSSETSITVPTEEVYWHRKRNALALGMYSIKGGFEAAWPAWFYQNVSLNGNLIREVGDPENATDAANRGYVDALLDGVKIRSVRLSANDTITIQSKSTQVGASQTWRQSVFLFGYDNGRLVYGIVGFRGSGEAYWSGTEGVSAASVGDGQFAITLPGKAYDTFVLISAEDFSIVT